MASYSLLGKSKSPEARIDLNIRYLLPFNAKNLVDARLKALACTLSDVCTS